MKKFFRVFRIFRVFRAPRVFCMLRGLSPDSFFGQLLLIVLLSAAVLQITGFYSVVSVQRLYGAEFLQMGFDYSVWIYDALLEMDAAQGEIFLEVLTQTKETTESKDGLSRSKKKARYRPFHFKILPQAPPWSAENALKFRRVRAAIETSLVEMLTEAGARAPVVYTRNLYEGDPEVSLGDDRYAFPLIQVAVRMDEDRWLEWVQPILLLGERALWRQRFLLLVESLAFSVGVTLFIRRVARPIARLRIATELLGQNPEMVQPLPETGSVELRETARSFNKMRQRICDNIKERNNMLEAMGHDLRTPLARIQLRIEKIEPEGLREKIAANVGEIRSIVEQGIELAQSLDTSEKAVTMDIAAFVESMVDDAEARGGSIVLKESSPDCGPRPLATARPICLRRCFDNLLSNAVKYAGRVEVSVVCEDDVVVIDVDDEGPGIPEDMLEKVFEPYYRLERSRNRASGGTGLGLSIARNMALLNGGTLTLANRPEGGLRARLTLRRVDPDTAKK